MCAADPDRGQLPEVPAAATSLFGQGIALAEEYAWLLTTDGVLRGLVGPGEAPRIWDRHLLNCAAIAERVPAEATVTDVGSGAGLPGIALAIARPDLAVTLIDSMARRTDFLTEVVGALALAERVRVVRARAEEVADQLPPAAVVTARALAPLDRLSRWCLPLAAVGGKVLAVKGESAAAEVAAYSAAVRRLGGGSPAIYRCGVGLVEPPATVVEIVRERAAPSASSRAAARQRRAVRSGRRSGKR